MIKTFKNLTFLKNEEMMYIDILNNPKDYPFINKLNALLKFDIETLNNVPSDNIKKRESLDVIADVLGRVHYKLYTLNTTKKIGIPLRNCYLLRAI